MDTLITNNALCLQLASISQEKDTGAQLVESAGLEVRPSLWLGINLQIPLNSQVLGEKGIRSNQVTMDTHAPHIPSPKLLLELLVCSRLELVFRFTSVTAECQQLVMTLFWTFSQVPASG